MNNQKVFTSTNGKVEGVVDVELIKNSSTILGSTYTYCVTTFIQDIIIEKLHITNVSELKIIENNFKKILEDVSVRELNNEVIKYLKDNGYN